MKDDSKTKSVDVMMEEARKFEPPEEFAKNAWISSFEQYKKLYERSVKDTDGFWGEIAEELEWSKKWDRVRGDYDFAEGVHTWFDGGKTNITVNCLDRHLKTERKNKICLIWQGEPEDDVRKFTYAEMYGLVCRFANALKALGVKKGDRVSIYLPMIPELPVAMMACARIGAIHSVVFGGFSADSLRDRILDSKCSMVITADNGLRSGKPVPLKTAADSAMAQCQKMGHTVEHCVVVKRTGSDVPMTKGRDFWWDDVMKNASDKCEAVQMDAEDTLFILYTSGSTGKPKGVLHTIGGYMVYCYKTFQWIFDYHDKDVFWCTADIGWVTGHSYIVYGPLTAGATSVMFEGVPTYPEPDRFWRIVDKFKVNTFYTAPTAIRALMREGEKWVDKCDLSTLRLLGTVGEPINPEAWMWYYNNVGRKRCPIVDTWWQTETGGILITPLPGAMATKPGSASLPFPGVEPRVIRQDGTECGPNEGGYLVIMKPWPGLMRRVYGDPERFKQTYFTQYPGCYYTGDGARVDNDGFYWLMGRVDDVINVSGHRIGTAEVESALVSHEAVAEAAVVGFPHDIKGQGLYAYVILKAGIKNTTELANELSNHVRKEIGPIAKPDRLQLVDALPKTRSGKIMRRILRKIAENAISELGDTTTLADPTVVDRLVEGRILK